jgi:hypothetical protein
MLSCCHFGEPLKENRIAISTILSITNPVAVSISPVIPTPATPLYSIANRIVQPYMLGEGSSGSEFNLIHRIINT